MGKARLVPAALLLLACIELIAFMGELEHTQQTLDSTKHQLAQEQNELRQTKNELNAQKVSYSEELTVMKAKLQKTETKAAKDAKVVNELSARAGSVVSSIEPLGTFRASYYTSYDQGCGYITKSGRPVALGDTIAVDPEVIPLGSKLYIVFPDGHSHVYTATDTGGAIVGNRLDIYTDTQAHAFSEGVKDVQVFLLH